MITEAQKHLIFDINCFYQLYCQYSKIKGGEPATFYPEISILAMAASSKGERLDWFVVYKDLGSKIQRYGLTSEWLGQLQYVYDIYVEEDGKTLLDFREEFLTGMQMLMNMIMMVVSKAPPSFPVDYMAQKVISDIFEADYWDGETVAQIQSVRKLTQSLGFEREFVDEFGTAFINLR